MDGKSLLGLGYAREFIRRWIGRMKIRKIGARSITKLRLIRSYRRPPTIEKALTSQRVFPSR